jgi:RimJ/RimL family protein N-acetyltransferase
VTPQGLPALRPWFTPERPGPIIFAHIEATGQGGCRVDRLPHPRAVLAEIGGNYALRGDPDALPAAELADVVGFVEAPPQWLPRLRESDPGSGIWPRVVATLPPDAPLRPPPTEVRRLTDVDADLLAALPDELAWIHATWGGPAGLLAAAVGHAAVVDGRIVSVAVPFYRGDRYEDIGVVTAAEHRRRGLSTACAAAVVADIRSRGRVPTWSTSPDNTGSLAVAERLGFRHVRDDVLYAVRTPIPT